MSRLYGIKTYIVALGLGAVSVAQYMEWITPEMAASLTAALTGAGLAALRHGVATDTEAVKKKVKAK